MLLKNKLPFWIALNSYVEAIVSGVPPLSLPKAKNKPVKELKAFGGTEQRNLPDNYLQRQYIYMMDGSYLLTDIVPTSDMRIELDIQTTSITSAGHAWLGARNGSAGSGLCVGNDGTKKLFFDGCSGTRYTSSVTANANTRYKYTWNNGVATIESGGSVVATNTFTPSDTISVPLIINGLNSSGSVVLNNGGIYCYGLKLWNGQGELVMDYVPAVQKGTVPVVGFYDTVSKTFMTATAGTFAAGAEAVPTPDTPMDIVCNNGVLKYGNVSKNLFDEDYPNVSNSVKYLSIYLGAGTYTCSYSFPHNESGTSLIYFLNGNVSAGASNGVNQVDASTPRTVNSSTGYVTIAYRNGSGIGLSGKVPTDYNCMLASGGTEKPYEPYRLAVYADGLQETINIHTKNLFDEQWNRNTGVSTQTAAWGQVVTASGWSTSGLVPVKAGQQYTVSYNTTVAIYVFYYESDGTMQQSYDYATSNTKKTFTVPNGATHIRLQVNKSTAEAIAALETQLETGATDTAYVPYFNGGTAVAEMLLSIGTSTDEQEVIAGNVTRKVGVKVLDGTESWTVASTNVLQADVFPVSSIQPAVGGYCTALSYTDSSTLSGMPENSFRLGSQVYPRRLYVKSSVYATDATTWTNYLTTQYAAGTPVIVVYPLATETTETVTGQPMATTAGDNIAEITQASMSGLELEVKYIKGA